MTDAEQIISGESPPVHILLDLMKHYPDQWKVKLPDMIHMPSGMRLLVGKTAVYVGGTDGVRLGIVASLKLRKAALSVTTWQMLAQARKAQLAGHDYMNPDHERAMPFTTARSAGTHPGGSVTVRTPPFPGSALKFPKHLPCDPLDYSMRDHMQDMLSYWSSQQMDNAFRKSFLMGQMDKSVNPSMVFKAGGVDMTATETDIRMLKQKAELQKLFKEWPHLKRE